MESDPLPTGIIIIDLRDEEERLMQEIAISKEKMNEAGGKGYILPLLKFNVLQKMAWLSTMLLSLEATMTPLSKI